MFSLLYSFAYIIFLQHPFKSLNSGHRKTAHIYEEKPHTLLRSTWVLSCPFLAGSVTREGWSNVADPAGQKK